MSILLARLKGVNLQNMKALGALAVFLLYLLIIISGFPLKRVE